jgi:hypothetical protein
MQLYIYKNGQQLGPFEKSAVVEMIAKGELIEDDWIFREFDTEWSKVGSLFKTINPVIVKFTLTSGLIIGWQLSSFTPIDVVYFKLPAETISTDNFKKRYLRDFYELWFGKNWQSGNEDDSRYQIVDEKIEILSAEDLAKAEWRQPDTRLYLIKNGKIEKVEQAEFETFPLIVQKIKKPKTQNTPEEIAVNQAMFDRNAEKLDPKEFIRKICEFQTWRVPIRNNPNDVIAGELPQIAVYKGLTEFEKVFCFFSDAQSYSDYANKFGEKAVQTFLTLSGDYLFAADFSQIDYINLNPFSDNALNYASDQFQLLNAMAGSIKIERKLREFHTGNSDEILVNEIKNHPHYFLIMRKPPEFDDEFSKVHLIQKNLGEYRLTIFTSPDLFTKYNASVGETLEYKLIAGKELGFRALAEHCVGIIFNPNCDYELEFGSELITALIG